MEIKIIIPTKEEILKKAEKEGISLSIAEDSSWSKAELGDFADKQGIYIHCRGTEILYVGQTYKEDDKNWATFGERFRREFQKSSAQESLLYQKLSENNGKGNKTIFFETKEIVGMIQGLNENVSNQRKILLIEQAMIAAYDTLINKR